MIQLVPGWLEGTVGDDPNSVGFGVVSLVADSGELARISTIWNSREMDEDQREVKRVMELGEQKRLEDRGDLPAALLLLCQGRKWVSAGGSLTHRTVEFVEFDIQKGVLVGVRAALRVGWKSAGVKI